MAIIRGNIRNDIFFRINTLIHKIPLTYLVTTHNIKRNIVVK